MFTLHSQNKTNDSVAQLVEQLTLNQWVESSNLSGVTIFDLRLNEHTIHHLNHQMNWGVSSAGLEHYLDRVGVIGSNPIHPTLKKISTRDGVILARP